MPESQSNRRTTRQAERRAKRPAVVDPNQLYSLDEAAAALDRSRAQMYLDFEAGRLHSIVDGRRRKVAGSEIIRVVREAASAASPAA